MQRGEVMLAVLTLGKTGTRNGDVRPFKLYSLELGVGESKGSDSENS